LLGEATDGDWAVFIDDSGGKWTGWPISINPDDDSDKTVVRTGGFWPYEWGESASQREAVASAQLIAKSKNALPSLLSMAEERNRFREALEDLLFLFRRGGEDYNDHFERIANRFLNETGMLRPGKSQADALMGTPTDEERSAAYAKWHKGFCERASTALKETQ
jgi:hypothetical protein